MVSTLSSSREECYGHPSFCNYKNPDVNISRSKLKVFCLTGYCSSGERVSLLTLKFGSGNRAGLHCVKSVRTRSVSGLYFPEFGLNTEIYRANLHIQSECGKIKTRKTPNMDTFHTVLHNDAKKSKWIGNKGQHFRRIKTRQHICNERSWYLRRILTVKCNLSCKLSAR